MQQKKAGLRSNSHADFVGNFEAATTFKTLFGQKDLNMTEKFGLIRGRKPRKECNVALSDPQPVVSEGLRPKPISTSFLEPAKNHGEM